MVVPYRRVLPLVSYFDYIDRQACPGISQCDCFPLKSDMPLFSTLFLAWPTRVYTQLASGPVQPFLQAYQT